MFSCDDAKINACVFVDMSSKRKFSKKYLFAAGDSAELEKDF